MGADGYSSGGTTRLSAKVPEELKRDFRDACDNADVTMTEAVEEFMAEFVAENGPAHVSSSDSFYPDDPALRELYEVCVDVADHSVNGLKIYQRRHGSRIAQRTQQMGKNDLPDMLMPLRRKGFVAEVFISPQVRGKDAKRWRQWLVKPPCADPEQWKYREGDA